MLKCFSIALLALAVLGSLLPPQHARARNINSAQAPIVSIGEGYWNNTQVDQVLERTLAVHLAPSLEHLNSNERQVLNLLLEVGSIFQHLYEQSQHPQAHAALEALVSAHPPGPDDPLISRLAQLYWLFNGPVATTLQNKRVPFLPVEEEQPGRNVYPWSITPEWIEAYISAHPEERDMLLHPRTVVKFATPANVAQDIAMLERHPGLALLHPPLEARLHALAEIGMEHRGEQTLYAVPYSLAYAPELLRASQLLRDAATHAQVDAPDFAQYLRLRATDLLSDDYEAGDAAWVTGTFGNINAQIGSYETYDDKLFGSKTFFGLSLLLRDTQRSEALATAIASLQKLQDALPYEDTKRIRSDIPVGVYNVVADFGQARSTNTATILPNDPDHSRKYGRTILLRYNLLTHAQLYDNRRAAFAAAVAPEHLVDFTKQSGFQRTLWHEVGHYLGPDASTDGRSLDESLGAYSDLFEELKADLVSLFAARHLQAQDLLDAAGVRGFYADGVLRVLQKVRPSPGQPYQNMQLIQMNHFLDTGVLSPAADEGHLRINYERFHQSTTQLLREVIAIQQAGDQRQAAAYVQAGTRWQPLHEHIATRMNSAAKYRYWLMRYGVLGQ